ncbi:CLUMA_CG009712, isoform A [Clunio marinus]|uniref:CLUMA_CG009712, isoform A n=1 Tax=Clunio marinus TaxID=568069 RepID=A0A1J1I9P1_9DIPT|nr:CLUMA_CG009712, isoform A [Clunio marinus]
MHIKLMNFSIKLPDATNNKHKENVMKLKEQMAIVVEKQEVSDSALEKKCRNLFVFFGSSQWSRTIYGQFIATKRIL